jgi:release factor glutamine methyltransferase
VLVLNLEDAERVRKILRATGGAPSSVYSPSDDSYLMVDAIAKFPVGGKKVLDVGTGSGVLGLFCALRGAQVTATDVDDAALHQAQKAADMLGLSLQLVLSDLFSKVQGKFDLILFNPPYLPSSTVEDRTVDGGRRGMELSKRFLDGLASYLKREGTSLLLVSTLNHPESVIRAHPEFQLSVVATRSLFFEELQVLSVRFRDGLAS